MLSETGRNSDHTVFDNFTTEVQRHVLGVLKGGGLRRVIEEGERGRRKEERGGRERKEGEIVVSKKVRKRVSEGRLRVRL